jgi:hypothetical protein
MIEPVRGHTVRRLRISSIASKNSLPSPGRCSSNQTAATSSSSSASAENSTRNVTERAWNGFAHEPRATVVPGPHRTMHAVHAARAPPPTPHGRRRGRRARHDRDWPGGLQRTRRGDRREGSAHHVGASPDRSPSPRRVSLPERDRRSACVRRHPSRRAGTGPKAGSVGRALPGMVTPAHLGDRASGVPGRPPGSGTYRTRGDADTATSADPNAISHCSPRRGRCHRCTRVGRSDRWPLRSSTAWWPGQPNR